jgi:hypothetical protein
MTADLWIILRTETTILSGDCETAVKEEEALT